MVNATQYLYKRARELGYMVEMIDKEKKVMRVTKNDKIRYVYNRSLPLNTVTSTKLTKNKHLTKKLLTDSGFSTTKGFLVEKFSEIQMLIRKGELAFPLVVKPNNRSLGIGVYANIYDIHELKKIFTIVLKRHDKILVEEHFVGQDYRVSIVDNKVVGVARRIVPFIVGNGKQTVMELIYDFNTKAHEEVIKINFEVKRNLEKQNVKLDSMVPEGRTIMLRSSANEHTLIEDVTSDISPYFSDIAIRACKTLGLRFAGIDLLTSNISNNFGEYVIIEVNGLPGFDIHLSPSIGETRDPSEAIWSAVFA